MRILRNLLNRLNIGGMLAFVVCVTFVLFACAKNSNPSSSIDEENESIQQDNKVVAHRGAWKEFNLPDNSFAAFEKALTLNFFGTECDIQITKDEQVVVFHDETIGGKFIKDQTYAEIISVHKLANGEDVPLLKDFLSKLKQSSSKTLLWLDVKSLSDQAGGNSRSILCAEKATELIVEEGVENKIKYIVGRKAVLDAAIASVRGKWECAYMNTAYTPSQFVSQGYIWANFDYNVFYTNPNSTQLALFNSYVSQNIKVSVYTVDDISTAQWFLALPNLYAISTNIPLTIKNLK